jgi:hypothetical protein
MNGGDDVVAVSAVFYEHQRFPDAAEDLALEHLVAALTVKACATTILPEAARSRCKAPRRQRLLPLAHSPGQQPWAVVGMSLSGGATHEHDIGHCLLDIQAANSSATRIARHWRVNSSISNVSRTLPPS